MSAPLTLVELRHQVGAVMAARIRGADATITEGLVTLATISDAADAQILRASITQGQAQREEMRAHLSTIHDCTDRDGLRALWKRFQQKGWLCH